MEALHSWHLYLSRKLIRIPGRILPPINLKGLNHIIPVGDQGNWTEQLKLLKMLETPCIEDWVVLVPSKYFSIVKQFVYNLRNTAEIMAFKLPEPEMLVSIIYLINYIIIISIIYKVQYLCRFKMIIWR